MSERAKNYEEFSERILVDGRMNETMRLSARVGWLESERKRVLEALDEAMDEVSKDPVENLYMNEDGVAVLAKLVETVTGAKWVPWWKRVQKSA